MLLRFIKNWTLPLAMLAGTAGYFFFARIPLLAPAKPCLNGLIALLTPALIFAQLLLTFCKVEVHELKPKAWHGWLLLFQTVSCLAVAALLVCCPMKEMYREVFEGAMVCLICPTATAAAVITGKLGGSASSLTTYTLLSNLLAAVAVPVGVSLGRAACRHNFLCGFSENTEQGVSAVAPAFLYSMVFAGVCQEGAPVFIGVS